MVYFQSADGAAAVQRQQMERQLNRSDPLTPIERRRVEGSLPLIDDFIMSLHATDEAQREERLQMFVPELGGTIHFINFPTSKMDEITDFVRRRFFHRYIKKIACTGGGAFKVRYSHKALSWSATKKMLPKPNKNDLYPFLLVNIGSGVSILKITGESQYERVSGTSLGGGTFLGLCRALSKLRTFDEAMDASVEGDSNEVDMTVGDIYGTAGYEQFHLKPDTVASSFGKAGARRLPHPPRDADLARSLLFMITQNLGQLAFLNARRVETKRIYFSGNFLRRNELACRQLAYAISFWSKGEMQAQFFHHEGFFGALGTFLQRFSSVPELPAVSETEENSSETDVDQSSSSGDDQKSRASHTQ
ncbi:hypothetical protein AM588_10004263 [Phytophthora nicotianae]|uniref:pantothenate kinase n=1 Tax=Phytophthora nicotianae TaxID=4792 RepID=A0A0W8D6B7_PHYNI|nr:hypothetical protein AM588_10004263 [Phytophthora nicotianae]